jgi:hypothetical protein
VTTCGKKQQAAACCINLWKKRAVWLQHLAEFVIPEHVHYEDILSWIRRRRIKNRNKKGWKMKLTPRKKMLLCFEKKKKRKRKKKEKRKRKKKEKL